MRILFLEKKLIFIVFICFVSLLFIYSFIFKSLFNDNESNYNKLKASESKLSDRQIKFHIDSPNINRFDLTQPLLPNHIYDQIKCRLSKKFYVSVTICVHDLDKDICEYIN